MASDEQQRVVPERLVSTRSTLVIGAAALIANFANYAFQIVAGRFMSVEEYGLFSGLMALVAVITVATSALQTTAARAIAVDEVDRPGNLLDRLNLSTLVVSGALFVVGVVISPIASRFFNVGSLPLILLGLYVLPSAFDSIAAGRLQGQRRFSAMALYSAAQSVAKLVFGVAVLLAGFRVTGLVGGLVLSAGVVALAGLLASRDAGSIRVHALDGEVRRAFVAFSLFWFMLGADVLFARAFFPEFEAGLYGAAAVVGKSVLWVPAIIAQILFPKLAQSSKEGLPVAAIAVRAGALVGAVVGVSVVVLYLTGDLMFSFLFGEQYEGAGAIAWKIGLAVAPLTLVNLLIQHFLARQQGAFLRLMAVVVVVQVVALYLGPKTNDFYVGVQAVAGTILLIGMLPPSAWRRSFGRGSPARRSTDGRAGADRRRGPSASV